jgi:non-specific serine/threonine protein kinase
MRLAEQASPGWLGYEQPAWLMRLKPEHDNLRAALEWSAANETTAPSGLKLVGVVAPFLEVEGLFAEERRWIDRLLERAGEAAPPAWRAVAYEHAIMAGLNVGPFHSAQSFALLAITLFRELEHKQHLAESLYFLGMLNLSQVRFTEARHALEESLTICRDRRDSVGASWCLGDLGVAVDALGEHGLGHAYLEQGLELCRKGKPGLVYGRLAYLLGNIFRHEGNRSQARSLYQEALTAAKSGIIWSLPYYIEGLAFVSLEEGVTLRAAKLLGAGDHLFETLGVTRVPLLQSEHDRAMVDLRAALDEQTLAAAWAEGQAMTTVQAVAYALDEPEISPP